MEEKLTPTTIVLYTLAVWRLSYMLVWEEGPGHVFGKLRNKVGVKHTADHRPYGESFLGELFSCLLCMSVWISLFITVGDKMLGRGRTRSLTTPLALSAGAILVNWIVTWLEAMSYRRT